MKKLIFIFLILLVVAASFENVQLTVQGAGGPVPFASVKLGNIEKFTDLNGKTNITKTVFQNTLDVKRLGFKEESVSLPFSIFHLNYHVGLVPENYSGIIRQLHEMLSGLNSYEYNYSLKVSGDGSTQLQTISAKFNRGNFLFSNKSDFTGADYTVLYKNKNYYLIKDGTKSLLEGEDKSKFLSRNIVFLSADDLVFSILIDEMPQSISYKDNSITILWKNAMAVLTVSKNGFLSELYFSQKSDLENIEVHFYLKNVNVPVEVK